MCAHCGKKPGVDPTPADFKLKRCAGCSSALYCSAECQKAEWPTHKQEVGSAFAGYTSSLALITAVKDWMVVANYTFVSMAKALVLAYGGIAANFASPRLLLFELVLGDRSGRSTGGGSAPANLFRVARASIVDRVPLHNCLDGDGWEEMEKACQKQIDHLRSDGIPRPTLVGSLPALFMLGDTGLVAAHHFPIYGTRNLGPGPSPQSQRAIYRDIIDMCIRILDRSLVFHHPDPNWQYEPQVCHPTRKKKEWLLQQLANWNWEEVNDPASKTGLPPVVLWCIFHQL
ncbi:hypothetical protein C8Q77DRAFT_1049495 [Trametes polyzona]|nr:hypothetical protein C8Q77DRAFT_1049495 [Trametes polyzona]